MKKITIIKLSSGLLLINTAYASNNTNVQNTNIQSHSNIQNLENGIEESDLPIINILPKNTQTKIISEPIEFSNIQEGSQFVEIEISNEYKFEKSPLEETTLFKQNNNQHDNIANKEISTDEGYLNPHEQSSSDRLVKLKPEEEISTLIFNKFFQLDSYILKNNDNDIFIEEDNILYDNPELSKSIDYKKLLISIGDKKYIKIPSKYIKKEGNVFNIELPTEYFYNKNYAIKDNVYKSPVAQREEAIYGNYSVSTPLDSSGSIVVATDLNYIDKNGSTFENKLTYKEKDKDLIRNKTTYSTIDDENQTKVSYGDVSSGNLLGQNSVNLMGLRVSSPYYHNRNSLTSLVPSVNVNGFSVNPTQMDILFNNVLHDRVQIGSGLYDLNIPLNQFNGDGTITTVTYDASGNPIRVDLPTFRNSQIVKKGALEYDVSIGSVRKNEYQDNFNYSGGYIFSATSLYGLTDRISTETMLQISKEGSSLLANINAYPNEKLGLVTFKGGINDKGESLFGLEYSKGSKNFNANLNMEMAGSDKFCYQFTNNCLKKQISAGLNYSLPMNMGRLSLFYSSKQTHHNITNNILDIETVNLNWNKQINPSLHTSLSLRNRKINNISDNGVFFTLNYYLDNKISTSTKVESNHEQNKFSQSIRIGEDRNNKARGYGSLQYNNINNGVSLNYGANLDKVSYRLYGNHSNNQTSGFANINGGFYYLPNDKTGGLTREATSNMGIVDIQEKDISVPIKINNNFEGYTNKNGQLIINKGSNQNIKADIDTNKLTEVFNSSSLSNEVQSPSSGIYKIPMKMGETIYQVKVNNVKEGAYFTLNNEYYVIDERGYLDLGAEGHVQLTENGKMCELNFVRSQTEYTCSWSEFEINKNDKAVKTEEDEQILFKK